MSVYANLSHTRRTKKDLKARKRAEYLATLPKHPVKRLFYRLHPKRVLRYWFSKRGLFMALKIVGVLILLAVLAIGSLFAYYRRDLDTIRPSELAKRVQTTITRYYDRNGVLLWEDKGDGNYTQTVKSEEINKFVKDATIAIEDRDFYQHHGISPAGLVRATFNNAQGGSTQGGSTLTQQLVKQVFFADESQDRGISGVPRKIKEIILAIEVERMYNKDQILTLYLNESPYGGRRNGVESGARTYFGKSAKDLTLAEAALLAGIPNQPGLYDPYNTSGHKALVARQHKVLDAMVETKRITKQQADEAKSYDILANIKPPVNAKDNIKAPHFVLEVRNKLEAELGKATVGRGGLTVKTTLDLRAQEAAENAIAAGAEMLPSTGADNASLSSIDVKTGQVIAMVGSVDYSKPGYGEQNSATSPLEPGSSIKPIADFAPLFKQREGINYAPGVVLRDENIDKIYCAGSPQPCTVQNYTRATYGDVTIRQSLASSLNRPAIKAMHIAGIEESLKTTRDLGDISYCKDNNDAGLSSAIGGGCTVRQVEHANAYASLARGGVYKPVSYILEVRNSSNEVLKKWEDNQAKQAVDPQVAYMLTSILSDPKARSLTFGSTATSFGFVIPEVWTATKTGTTENGKGAAKDSWILNYSPVVATAVWTGNHDGSALRSDSNTVVRRITNNYMRDVHKQVYEPSGQWKPNDQIPRPDGIKDMSINGRADVYPSWFDQKAGRSNAKVTFDSVSKKKATNCTPDTAKVEVDVSQTTDPITKKATQIAPDGYDASKDDDVHKCDDVKPSVSSIEVKNAGGGQYQIIVNSVQGSHQLTNIKVQVGPTTVADASISDGGVYTTTTSISTPQTITATIQDNALYSGTNSVQFTPNQAAATSANPGGTGNSRRP
jgi:membrane peptidoglycan carboxypeptidase